jgi:hypothetical protein
VALVIQNAKCMCHTIFSSVACPAVPYFPHYPINSMTFGKKLMKIKCVFELNIQHNTNINVCSSSHKPPIILIIRYWNLKFLDRFFRNSQMSNLMKIHPVGAELLHANRRMDGLNDGHTDLTKLTATFHSFVNATKNSSFSISIVTHW